MAAYHSGMATFEHPGHVTNPERLRVREAHDRSWAAWQMAVRRVDAANEAAIRPVRVRSTRDPERNSPLPGGGAREKIQRGLFDD